MRTDRTHFTPREADALLGSRYRATAPYSGVPAGTVGRVYASYEVANGLRGLDIVWELPPTGAPADHIAGGRTDGFSREDLYLVFTAGAQLGQRAMVPLDGPDGAHLPVRRRSRLPVPSPARTTGLSVDRVAAAGAFGHAVSRRSAQSQWLGILRAMIPSCRPK